MASFFELDRARFALVADRVEKPCADGTRALDQRSLVREAEAWAQLEGGERPTVAVERCAEALGARILPA
jgi:hypothetical protein